MRYRGEDYSDGPDFADPTGKSSLRAASKRNPRNLPCPNCGGKNRLTPADRALGYQCDSCADRAEGGFECDDGSYPPPCPGRRDHFWVVADEDNGGDGRCYCAYCLADGDA